MRSQEEEEKFCWEWRTASQVDHFGSLEEDVSACRSIDCCGNMVDVQCFIIARTFDFLTSPSTNCNLSLICSRRIFLIITSISPV